MDAQRTSFVLTIAALFAGIALAEPPSQSAPVRYGNPAGQSDWSSAGPTTVPTISASPSDRYSNPQYTYPQSTQPQSITGRAQNAFNETANSLRNGIDTGVRAAGDSLRSTAQQTLGTAGYPSQLSNPFSTQPAAPPASSATRSLAPPPWPAGSGTPAPPATPSWDSSTPVTPVDRSVLPNPSAPRSNSAWTSIGSTVAAPPLLVPQMPTTRTLAPLNITPLDSGPSFTTDSYRGGQPSFGSAVNTTPQSTSPSTVRSTSAADDWAATWDASANNNNAASIGRTGNNSPRPSSSRDLDFSTSQPTGSNQPDARSTAAKPTDSWTDDSWSRNSQPSQNGIGASIGASKTAAIGSAGSSAPAIQAPSNAAPLSPATIGSAGNSTNFGGPNPNAPQQSVAVNAAKPTQAATATGEPQPWVTLLAAILGLAGSLAGNVYLGWSYLNARQKYQALVRRTADTFRRTKVAA